MHLDPPLVRNATVDSIRARLGDVRQGITYRVWVEGLSRTLWLVLTLGVLDFVLDWTFRMDRAQRGILLTTGLLLLGWNVYRRLVVPLLTRASDEAIALQLEKAHPRLGQSLISALQLSRLDDVRRRGMSQVLVEQAITKGGKSAQEIEFSSILDSRRLGPSLILLITGIVCFFLLTLAMPVAPALRTWFSRNILLSAATWPQKTHLIIERQNAAGNISFARGNEWTQVVSVSPESKAIPDTVYLDCRSQGTRSANRSIVMQ